MPPCPFPVMLQIVHALYFLFIFSLRTLLSLPSFSSQSLDEILAPGEFIPLLSFSTFFFSLNLLLRFHLTPGEFDNFVHYKQQILLSSFDQSSTLFSYLIVACRPHLFPSRKFFCVFF